MQSHRKLIRNGKAGASHGIWAIHVATLLVISCGSGTEVPPSTMGLAPRSPRIIGGTPAPEGVLNVGSMVMRRSSCVPFGFCSPDGPGSDWIWAGCSGTLISRRVFITAAHCVAWAPKSFEWGVAFAPDFHATDYNTVVAAGVAVYSVKAHPHPDFTFNDAFDQFSTDPDVAILVLDRSAKGIQPASFVERGFFDGAEGTKVLTRRFGVAGYGYGSLDALNSVIPRDFSMRRYTTMKVRTVYPGMVVFDRGRSACFEDSGGPAFPLSDREGDEAIPRYVSTVTALVRALLPEDVAAGRVCQGAIIFTRMDTPTVQAFVRGFLSGDNGDQR